MCVSSLLEYRYDDDDDDDDECATRKIMPYLGSRHDHAQTGSEFVPMDLWVSLFQADYTALY